MVFEEIFARVAGGFVVEVNRKGHEINASQIYEATLSFLYKLLFLFYAEARNLLPIDRDYREYSLTAIAQEIAVGINQPTKKWSHKFSKFYDNLITLFQIIDRGDADLEVPRYNGGLFHFDQADLLDKFESNYFLNCHQLSDGILAPVIDKLARFEGQAIDYSFLGVRQLGSIYEGLLEYRLVIDNPVTGEVHLENDKGDRKASGSYYTPDYIVKYIVSHTLKPILETREREFKLLMGQISELQQQKNNKRLGLESLQGLDRQLGILERQSQTILLDIKVCDPAMGSGHFLVEAVDFLTDELIQIINVYPDHNPILKMLDQMRNSIVENLRSQGIRLDPSRLEPTQLLQRVVMKRCIYGVDLNPMAVELAKVSLWLHSFTIGAPLSFLDHHLRCGNSLIGTTAREAEVAMSQEKKGNAVQFSLLTGPFVGLLRAAEIMRGVSVLSDATFAEVEQSERLFKQFDESAKPFKKLLDIYVSQFFGIKRADHFLRVHGTNAIAADISTMNKADLKLFEDVRKLYEEKRFFHWDLEFPEVFIDLENANWSENPGFDAVIGNPPYDVLAEKERKENLTNFMSYIQSSVVFKESLGGKLDLYRLFVCRSLNLGSKNSYMGLIIPMSLLADQQVTNLRKYLLQSFKLFQINAFPQKDDSNRRIFKEAKLPTCIIFLKNNLLDRSIHITVHPNNLFEEVSSQFSLLLSEIEMLDNISFSIPLTFSENKSDILKKLIPSSKIQKMKNICSNYQGEINETTMANLISLNPQDGYRILRGGNIQRYEFITEPKQGVPKYLNIEAYRQKISGEKSTHTLYPRIGYQRNAALDNWKRLIFAPLPNSSYCFDSISYFLIENSTNSTNAFTLLAILNSRLLEWRFRLTSTNNHVSTSEIDALPIRKINFTTTSDRRQQGLENLINLYQQYQTDHQLDPILIQCGQHLNQQPEEADIIHDFLAHLAEQMIQLNQQKQTEIKGFLKWLERFIGCPVDTLKNKSKIQNYLGDYTKQQTLDPALNFDGLITILNQNKKLIKPTFRRLTLQIE